MSIKFSEDDHRYYDDEGNYKSVSSILHLFQEPFDADKKALKNSKDKKSKYYGMSPEQIKEIWAGTNKSAIDLGNWYHKERERQICEINNIEHNGETCNIVRPIFNDNIKIAPDQTLQNNHIYPEHFMYLKSHKLCGQSDLVQVINNKISISDFKTNKNLTTEGYTMWDGSKKMLLDPVSHLEDCKLNIYNIQLSLYMYMALKHNPQFTPGKLVVHHIIFEEIDEDKFGNKQLKKDTNGDPIVKEIKKYNLPYLKNEVQSILKIIK
jgi:hypothetical protein